MKKQTYTAFTEWGNEVINRGGEVNDPRMLCATATVDTGDSEELLGEWNYVSRTGWLRTTDPEPSVDVTSTFNELVDLAALPEPNVYAEHGYDNREHYLSSLAKEYEADLELVKMLAAVFGRDEDFDGLVEALKDLNGGV